MAHIRIGIDPGWKNLGLAILAEDNSTLLLETINCSEYGTPPQAVRNILERIAKAIPKEDGTTYSVGIERYVVYGKGTPMPNSEELQQVIGALWFSLQGDDTEVLLQRAIDWKQVLCKHLFKTTGYRNPSSSFDKKYSFSIAEAICGKKPKKDHEADAIGIAYISDILIRERALLTKR